MTKSQTLCFSISATIFVIFFLGFLAVITEWLRIKNVFVGYSDGRLYSTKNQSFFHVGIYNITDLCTFQNQFVIVNKEGNVYFDYVFLFKLPIHVEWCANKHNDELYFGSDEGVIAYPSMRRELWRFKGTRSVDWINGKWKLGDQSFRYLNDDTVLRLNYGALELYKISVKKVLQREYIGPKAKGLTWV